MEIIKPHNKKSLPVTVDKIPFVLKEAAEMLKIIRNPRGIGIHAGGHALAHCQVTDYEPRRFFVLRDGRVIVNAEITNKTKVPVYKQEGCLSFHWKSCNKAIPVPRSNKCTVRWQTITKDKTLSDWNEENYSGIMAQIMQHEIDHFDGVNIYDRAGKMWPLSPEEEKAQGFKNPDDEDFDID